MKSLIKFLLTAVMSLTAIVLPAQSTVYPIQINAVMMPPYTNCLGDYFNAGANRVQIKAILRDLYKSDLKFSLSVKVKSGNTVHLESVTPYPIELDGANLINDLGQYVTDLFSPAADNKGVRYTGDYSNNGYCLPEGAYEFVFQVFDFYNRNVPLSEPFSLYCYLQQAEPPVAVYPEDGACGIGKATGITSTGVQLQWMDPIAIGPKAQYYEVVLTEKNSTENMYGMFSDKSSPDNLLDFPDVNKGVYNSQFLYIPNTAGTFQENKEYCWYVIAKSSSIDITNEDLEKYANDYGYYPYKNHGKSNVNCFTYGECKKEDPLFKDKYTKSYDETTTITIKSFTYSKENGTATVEWDAGNANYCQYYVYYYRSDQNEGSAEKVVTTSTTLDLQNLEPGYSYTCYVVGVIECATDDSGEKLSAKSEEKTCEIPKTELTTTECANLQARNCDNLVTNLAVKDEFYGNSDDELITVKSLEACKEEGVYNGTGVVSCSLLKNKLGLNVVLKDVKLTEIDSKKYLCSGTVEVVTSTSNNLMLNLNDVASKKQGADKADQQETLGDEVKDKEEAAKHTNSTVIIDGQLNVVDANGKTEPVGTVVKSDKLCELPQSGLDNEDGVVRFSVNTELLGKVYGNNPPAYYPYIDESASPFQSELIKKGYESQSSEYPIPWVEMVEGETRLIVASIDRKAKESATSLKMSDVDFYCYAADGSAVKLEKTAIPGAEDAVAVKIYGGTKNTSLKIYARKKAEKENDECSSENKTLGVLNVYTMSHDTKNILLVPVLNANLTDDEVREMEAEVNKKFAPLGKTFKFKLDDAFTEDEDDILGIILENGLNIDEDANRFTKETTAMKYIRTQYSKNTSVNIEDYNACLFLIPSTSIKGVQGYMPIGKSVGYIVVGSNNDKVDLDANTISHELCHGLYSIQHVFDYNGVGEGVLPENIMDYPNDNYKEKEGEFRHLTKYFQWVDVEKERQIHLSFLDDTEDGAFELITTIVRATKCAAKGSVKYFITRIISSAFPNKEEDDGSQWTKWGKSVAESCADEFLKFDWKSVMTGIGDLINGIKCMNDDNKTWQTCICEAGITVGLDYAGSLISKSLKKAYKKLNKDQRKKVCENMLVSLYRTKIYIEKVVAHAKKTSGIVDVTEEVVDDAASATKENVIKNMVTSIEKKYPNLDENPFFLVINALLTDEKKPLIDKYCGNKEETSMFGSSDLFDGTSSETSSQTAKEVTPTPTTCNATFNPKDFNLPNDAKYENGYVSFSKYDGTICKCKATINACKVVSVSIPDNTIFKIGSDFYFIKDGNSTKVNKEYQIIGDKIIVNNEVKSLRDVYSGEVCWEYFLKCTTEWLEKLNLNYPSKDNFMFSFTEEQLENYWKQRTTNSGIIDNTRRLKYVTIDPKEIEDEIIEGISEDYDRFGQLKYIISTIAQYLGDNDCSANFRNPDSFKKEFPAITLVPSNSEYPTFREELVRSYHMGILIKVNQANSGINVDINYFDHDPLCGFDNLLSELIIRICYDLHQGTLILFKPSTWHIFLNVDEAEDVFESFQGEKGELPALIKSYK